MESEIDTTADIIKQQDAEIARLCAALAKADARIKHMSEVLVDAEELLGVEETGELILRPIERLLARLAEVERERDRWKEGANEL